MRNLKSKLVNVTFLRVFLAVFNVFWHPFLSLASLYVVLGRWDFRGWVGPWPVFGWARHWDPGMAGVALGWALFINPDKERRGGPSSIYGMTAAELLVEFPTFYFHEYHHLKWQQILGPVWDVWYGVEVATRWLTNGQDALEAYRNTSWERWANLYGERRALEYLEVR